MKPQKTVTISIPPRLPAEELDVSIASLDGLRTEVYVMAASLGFTRPMDLCGLRALVDLASSLGGTVYMDCPTSQDVHGYLARMNFYVDLADNVILSAAVPKIRRKDRRENLVELRRINCGDDVADFIGDVWGVTKGHFGDSPLANACATALGAATENVLNHAASPVGALVAAQRYMTGLELAVVDLGVGIPETLRRNPEYRPFSDIEAIEKALDDHVSSTGEPSRGSGLHELVTAVQRAGNSTLVIRSGKAHLTMSVKDGVPHVSRRVPAQHVTGTWISVRLEP